MASLATWSHQSAASGGGGGVQVVQVQGREGPGWAGDGGNLPKELSGQLIRRLFGTFNNFKSESESQNISHFRKHRKFNGNFA